MAPLWAARCGSQRRGTETSRARRCTAGPISQRGGLTTLVLVRTRTAGCITQASISHEVVWPKVGRRHVRMLEWLLAPGPRDRKSSSWPNTA
jgi:hypothetical protein